MAHLSFCTNFGSLELLAADIWVTLCVHPFKFSKFVLLFLMFLLIFINMQIRSFIYHTIGLKYNVSTFIW